MRRVEIGEDGLVESEVGPAGHETENGKPEGGAGEERSEGQDRDDADVDEGETGDAHREDAAEEGNRMRWDELAEGDEEADLNGDRAGNDRQTNPRDVSIAS